MRNSMGVGLAAVFAAMHVVLYSLSFGLWRNWAIYIESLEGIVLGPRLGFVAALLGSSIARMVRPDSFWMFGIIAEPISVLTAGFLSKSHWKPVLAMYLIMLSTYFIHPLGMALPIWAILDILLAMFLIYPVARLAGRMFNSNMKHLSILLPLISFVCIATDSLVRVFLLVPTGLYGLFFSNFDGFYTVFVGSAIESYLEDVLVVVVSFLAGVPLLFTLSKTRLLPSNGRETENKRESVLEARA